MPSVRVGEGRGVPIDLYYQLLPEKSDASHKILFIIGFLTSHHAWAPQMKFFKDKKEFQICVFDNRGSGQSTVSYTGYSSSQLAQDALELCDHLQWQKFHVVAISMGGMIAIEMALHSLDRVLSLSLGVTHCGGWSSLVPVLGVWKMLKSVANLDIKKQSKVVQSMLYSQEFLDRKIEGEDGNDAMTMHEKLAKEWAELNKVRQSPFAFFGHLKTVFTHSVSFNRLHALKEANIPILVMTGTKDDLVKPINSHELHKFLEVSEFVEFKGAGHCVNLECETEFNAAILANIQKAIAKYPL